ncbi:chemotaxis protein CheD [Frigidibacter oleivorans]|uniref:chemotaxis protein CheD n=1 Tax=Frigidibacter oleivorans TaxID=2487129 RepID=UPI000F8C7AAD|nr:chemotaxis protein CheD [Frigidibacter oleivorans]
MAVASRFRFLGQGEYVLGDATSAPIATVLGSCVAACLHDPVARRGGMNHFLLPEGGGSGSAASPASFGVNAMELLINALLRAGAERGRLQAKVFGGASLRVDLTDIGARNAAFIAGYLRREGIACLGQSLGGTSARRVEFWPGEGRARQRLVQAVPDEIPVPARPGNGVELFD